jgi:4-hydroxy-2-oxoheptanedioate aldolase
MSSLSLNQTIRRLQTGQPAVGVWATDRSPDGAAFYASADLDFVLYDMEHGPFDIESLRVWLQFFIDRRRDRTGELPVTPIARIPAYGYERNYWIIKQVLDLGFLGIVVPHVHSAEDAAAAVRAGRYPQASDSSYPEPRGYRGARPAMAARYWGLTQEEYVARADLWPLKPEGELLLVVMIETREGLDQVEAIVRVPGIGVVMVGPYDLSFALGVPGQTKHPAVQEAIAHVLTVCQAHGVPCGIAADPEDVPQRLAQGFRWVVTREIRLLPRRS